MIGVGASQDSDGSGWNHGHAVIDSDLGALFIKPLHVSIHQGRVVSYYCHSPMMPGLHDSAMKWRVVPSERIANPKTIS